MVTYIGGRLVAGTILPQIGMKERFFSVDLETNQLKAGCSNSDLAANAAMEAIKNASICLNDIDLIILTTSTPDYPSPLTSNICCIWINSGSIGMPRCC